MTPTPQPPSAVTDATEYVVLIVGDADRWWTSMTTEQRRAGYATYGRFGQQLAERGHVCRPLAALGDAIEVRRVVTDAERQG